MSDIEKLEALQAEVHNVRAMLPRVLQRIATLSDEEDSEAAFRAVARDLTEWQTKAQDLERDYVETKATIEALNEVIKE